MHHLVFMAQSIHYETPVALGFRVTSDGIRQRCQGPRGGSHSGQIQTVQVIITHHVRLDAHVDLIAGPWQISNHNDTTKG